MLDSLKLIFQRLLNDVSTQYYRFLYDLFSFENRLIGLVGPRGVGKTTLFLQIIKNHFHHQKPEKTFLNNTNLYSVLETQLNARVELGTVRELFFLQSLKNAGISVFHNKIGDFEVGKYVFEIGGKNKTRKQLKVMKNAYLVKDEMLTSRRGEIPLMYFGFLC